MSNPFDTSSPFNDNSSTAVKPSAQQAPQEEFSIHTMQDDLAQLAKNPQAFQTKNQPKEEAAQKLDNVRTPASQVLATNQQPEKEQVHISATSAPTQAHPIATPAVEKTSNPEHLTQPVEILVNNNANKGSGLTKAIIIFIILLIVGILGLGGYYFWSNKQAKPITNNTTPVATPQETKPEPQPQTQSIEQQPTEKYSTSNPNFLSLDLATLTPSDIQTSIKQIATELQKSTNPGPYEFVVVDANNNPVAFPIFATAAKLNLQPALLSSLGENFSLYVFNDAGNTRLALAAAIKNKSVLSSELPKQEKTFAKDAEFLFLGNSADTKANNFGSGNYKDHAVRYLNLNPEQTLSIDYTLTDLQFIIGTSKNTLRATLDKILSSEASTAYTISSKNESISDDVNLSTQSIPTNSAAPIPSNTPTPPARN